MSASELSVKIDNLHFSADLKIGGILGGPNGILDWYFPGPDGRYNGESAWIPVPDLPKHRHAAPVALDAYRELVVALPEGVEAEKPWTDGEVHYALVSRRWKGGVEAFPGKIFSRVQLRSEEDLSNFLALLDEAERVA